MRRFIIWPATWQTRKRQMILQASRCGHYFSVENLTREAFWNVYRPGCKVMKPQKEKSVVFIRTWPAMPLKKNKWRNLTGRFRQRKRKSFLVSSLKDVISLWIVHLQSLDLFILNLWRMNMCLYCFTAVHICFLLVSVVTLSVRNGLARGWIPPQGRQQKAKKYTKKSADPFW